MTNARHGRFCFFRSPATAGGSPTTIPGSTDQGTYQCAGFSRFVGLFSSVGSMTLRWQMGVHSGDYQVTSSIVINSGGNVFDQLNVGLYTNFTITAANSQTPDFLLMGERYDDSWPRRLARHFYGIRPRQLPTSLFEKFFPNFSINPATACCAVNV
jgi:hypothetical protein